MSEARLGLPEATEPPALQALLDHRALLDLREQLARLVELALLVQQDPPDPQAPQEMQALLGSLELLDQLALWALQGQPVLLDLRVQPDSPETLDLLAPLELKAPKA